ncbi:hypothetical protein B1748_19935 [Paenibacillus sp. MY03]|uniref:hypothetical protein n=1 Tax=Paenibacillus sp. MY03 TaxID=302980 RepID=UPI000B3D2B54|nr:hypothetical protein [Paenibacillus sp. MY03]OUS74855.1 hypothetical protein B1748_19935 [Paenibacillus sp. MY03]
MIKQLQERKKALQSVRKRLDGNAPLHSKDGLRYMRCLAKLVMTDMQIEQLQSMKKDACQRPQ